MDDSGNEDILLARFAGTLAITTECVLISSGDEGDRPRTVIWTEGRVSFDAASESITFVAPTSAGEPTVARTFRDGDEVELGGYGRSAAEGPIWDYVQPPGESCPPDIWHAQLASHLVSDSTEKR
jgi:hypothetical protein